MKSKLNNYLTKSKLTLSLELSLLMEIHIIKLLIKHMMLFQINMF